MLRIWSFPQIQLAWVLVFSKLKVLMAMETLIQGQLLRFFPTQVLSQVDYSALNAGTEFNIQEGRHISALMPNLATRVRM